MAILRSLDSSCNPQKTIKADNYKNDKPKGEKKKICICHRRQYGKTR